MAQVGAIAPNAPQDETGTKPSDTGTQPGAGAAGRVAGMDYPKLHLSNSLLELTVFLPHPEKGYYRGRRFDWSGMVGQVEYRGHTFFEEWRTPHDPENYEHAIGTAEEFDIELPPGYAEARVGEPFLKIGVGLLEKVEEPRYRFSFPYKLLQAGAWRIRSGKDWVEFRQEMGGPRGFGYRYTKHIRLTRGRPAFTIAHSLKNTGSRLLETTHYGHNFFLIDGEPAGPSYTLRFPFAPTAKQSLRGFAELRGKELIFNQDLPDGVALFAELQGFGSTARDNAVTVENRGTGTGAHIQGDLPPVKFNFFAVKTAVCPEPFVAIRLAPGQEKRWQSEYTFYLRRPSR